jgi:hypothetical protein
MICTAFPSPDWQSVFVKLLPAIRKHARIAFRHLDPESCEEAVQAVVCNACCAIARLAELDKLDLAYASALARFGVAQVKDGRMTGGSMNCRDVSSRYCQRARNITVQRLDRYDAEDECWKEVLVPDNTCTPAELAASRIDFPAWLRSLKSRDRRVARFLSHGNSTKDAARTFDVSPSRVSQLRRELQESWREFTGERNNFGSAA